jgi:very-short-patch-repair endonuclease
MQEAVHYGKVELIPGLICDGYVLNNGTAVMSERGTADLLGMNQMALNRMKTTGAPKTLKPFIDKDWSMKTTLVKVVSKNSPYEGRQIVVYNSDLIETIIRAYVIASGHNALQKNQLHIGERCSILVCALTRTALEVSIKQACGLSPDIQKTAQQHYTDAVKLIKDYGFTCSAPNDIAIKKDITKFLEVPESTLNSFLRKHRNDIEPIKLDISTIRSLGYKAPRMNGYYLEDVSKIALGMDSVIGLELKKQLFGQTSSLAKLETRGEIEWLEVLTKVFAGLGLYHNYPIGQYKVDFFVEKLMLVLECNGYDNHLYYDPNKERQREQFISQRYGLVRFHHHTHWETLMNAIFKAKTGTVIKLYQIEHLYPETNSPLKPGSLSFSEK